MFILALKLINKNKMLENISKINLKIIINSKEAPIKYCLN